MLKLPLPRRRPSYYRKPYYNKPKRYSKVSWLWIALSIPVLIIALELLIRVMVGITGKNDVFANYSPIEKAYNLKFLTETQEPIQGLTGGGELVVTRNPSSGYKLVDNQKNQFLKINPQGFRDSAPLPLAKPKNEFRIFILGGSTAFGQGSKNNEATIAHDLETRLKQRVAHQQKAPDKYRPDVFPFFIPSREKLQGLPAKIHPKQYRVINAGIPGYASGNSLAQFALDVLPYQPDLIIVLDGYTDLMLPSDQTQADIPKIDEFLEDASAHFRTYLSQSFNNWLGQAYLIKTLDQYVLKPQPSLAQSTLPIPTHNQLLTDNLPKNKPELQKRVNRYQDNHQQLVRLASIAKIPVILATQPEITGRQAESLLPQEKVIRQQLGKNYLNNMPKSYGKIAQENQKLAKTYPNNVKSINLYNFNPKLSKPMFSDTIHLTESGNKLISEKLYDTITSWEKLQIIPENYYLKD